MHVRTIAQHHADEQQANCADLQRLSPLHELRSDAEDENQRNARDTILVHGRYPHENMITNNRRSELPRVERRRERVRNCVAGLHGHLRESFPERASTRHGPRERDKHVIRSGARTVNADRDASSKTECLRWRTHSVDRKRRRWSSARGGPDILQLGRDTDIELMPRELDALA